VRVIVFKLAEVH